MGELWALVILGVALYAWGFHRGHTKAENAYTGIHVGMPAGKCSGCGVLVEGGGIEMEAHSRFYCPKGN